MSEQGSTVTLTEDLLNEMPRWQRPLGVTVDPFTVSETGGPVVRNMAGDTIQVEPTESVVQERGFEITAPSVENLKNNLGAMYNALPTWSELGRGILNLPGAIREDLDRAMFSGTVSAGDAVSFAGGVGVGSLPMRTPEGALRIFGGLESKAGTPEISRFLDLEGQGVAPADIWRETQMFRGPDGQIRTEISDFDADLNRNTIQLEAEDIFGEPAGTQEVQWLDLLRNPDTNQVDLELSDVLSHKGLYEAYPDLQDMPVIFKPLEDGSLGRAIENGIVLNNSLADPKPWLDAGFDPERAAKLAEDRLTRVLLHEVQHHVQRIEGFDTGASPAVFEFPQLGKSELRAAMQIEALADSAVDKGIINAIDDIEIRGGEDGKNTIIFHQGPGNVITATAEELGLDDKWLNTLGEKTIDSNHLLQMVDDGLNQIADVTDEELLNSLKVDRQEIIDRVVVGLDKDPATDPAGQQAIAQAIAKAENFARYERTVGEIEARDVEERFSMTPETQRMVPPELVTRELPVFRRRPR